MASEPSRPGSGGGRDLRGVALACACLLGVVALTAAVPVLSPAATASPAESLVPVPGGSGPAGSVGDRVPGGGDGALGGGLGALNPGTATSVGGGLGGTDALQSRSAETHFVVRSTRPAYWRTGAYETYTGSGWNRDDTASETTGPVAPAREDWRRVVYDVHLNRSARALPTVWRPHRVSRDQVLVTDALGVRAGRPLPAGTTYTGVSYQPPRDAATLRRAGRDYPSAVAQEYTRLPASTAAELGPTAGRVTEGAGNPYERARAVEDWLERTKTYSLNASHPPGSDPAVAFVHEMDAGYCEYFATTMVAMLRTQDVPARYVVGYSTGRATGEGTYEVRGMNAHAWVEVYFPDVGWVRFDPTPAADRQDANRESYRRDSDGEYDSGDPPEPGDEPTETPSGDGANGDGSDEGGTPDGDGTGEDGDGSGDGTGDGSGDPDGTPGDEGGDDGTDGDDPQSGQAGEYDVRLNRSAVPGATVRATVTRADDPVVGATVLFNGERVGETDEGGNVTGEVPYADRLDVTVQAADPARAPADGRLYAAPEPERVTGATLPDGSAAAGTGRTAATQDQSDGTVTFEVETTARIDVQGTARTGAEVAIRATVADVPVRGATVTVDGDQVGETDDDGRATVRLPTEPGRVTLGVRREPVAGSTNLSLPALNVTATPAGWLLLPGSDVTVAASMGGEPVAGAPVLVGGERVATTGVDGTATVRVDGTDPLSVAVEEHEQRATVTTASPLVHLGLVGGALLALVAGVAVGARHAGITRADLRALPRRAGQLFAAALVAAGALVDDALSRLALRARLTAAHVRALVDGRRSASDLLAMLVAWWSGRVETIRVALASTARALGVDARAVLGDDPSADAVGSASGDSRRVVRDAWSGVLERTSVGRPRTHTPGEIATHAVAVDDLPEDAVRTIVDSFRAVEYGRRDPGDARATVERAHRHIEADDDRRIDGSGGSGDGGGGPGSAGGRDDDGGPNGAGGPGGAGGHRDGDGHRDRGGEGDP